MPKVLIVTRTKNRTCFIPRAVGSILSQIYSDWHHVIVNDGGNACELEQAISPFRSLYKDRLTIINNVTSMGMETASNIGINSSDSKYIAIHDDDDSWENYFLLEMVNALEFNNVDGVVCHVSQCFEQITEGEIKILSKRYYNPDLVSCNQRKLKYKNQFMPISFVFSREAYLAIEGFDENFLVCGDWDFHYRFIKQYRIKVISKRLANYHIRSGDVSDPSSAAVNSVHKKELHARYRQEFFI
ncbi:TPA: glycosyltransferase family 2 protein, partial [Kluyvera ascorbata]|nr:glycosyltransferase family 2 protein [Kluyvera ascorbata]